MLGESAGPRLGVDSVRYAIVHVYGGLVNSLAIYGSSRDEAERVLADCIADGKGGDWHHYLVRQTVSAWERVGDSECPECGAAIPQAGIEKHAEWHRSLPQQVTQVAARLDRANGRSGR